MVGYRGLSGEGGWRTALAAKTGSCVFPTHLNDLQHLETRDAPVTVQVVHFKGPIEFLLEATAGGDRTGANELPEVDGAVAVLVEGAESVLRELGGVTIGEELRREHAGLGRSDSSALAAHPLAAWPRPRSSGPPPRVSGPAPSPSPPPECWAPPTLM